jgi:hypothetical protein
MWSPSGRTRSSHLIPSRLLKNWVEGANFLFLDDRFLCCEFISYRFSCSCASQLAFAAPWRDTTAQTYRAGNAAAIRFRMHTKL